MASLDTGSGFVTKKGEAMLNKQLEEALSRQTNAELYSGHLYLSMSAYLGSVDLPGAANWMKVRAQEKLTQAEAFFDFVKERGGQVKREDVGTLPAEWDSALAAFESAYAHERKVTELINDLVALARAEKDDATACFLQWFVAEQAEEESSARAIVKKLTLVGDEKGGLMTVVDRQLGRRRSRLPVESAVEDK